jgi:hypothetical protein
LLAFASLALGEKEVFAEVLAAPPEVKPRQLVASRLFVKTGARRSWWLK